MSGCLIFIWFIGFFISLAWSIGRIVLRGLKKPDQLNTLTNQIMIRLWVGYHWKATLWRTITGLLCLLPPDGYGTVFPFIQPVETFTHAVQ
jgi:hypothetical protein